MNKKAFTLAEIVVAVAIIGTIVTLTIPTFFANSTSQKNQYVNGLKKAYSELFYATEQLKASNGGTLLHKFDDLESPVDSYDDIGVHYGKYLKYAKICAAGGDSGNCWHTPGNSYQLNGTPFNNEYLWNYRVILNDGVLLSFYNSSSACDFAYQGLQVCGYIWVDVNGFKGPNKWGRDIFRFYLLESGLRPFGDGDTVSGTCLTNNSGAGCTAKVLREGNMNY